MRDKKDYCMKYTVFIADLHLTSDTPNVLEALVNLAKELTPEATALYILGDFFALWAGDDEPTEFNAQVIAILKQIAQKTKVYLMPGNRDFLLGKDFASQSNCTLLKDPTKIYLYGRPTILSHGDRLCKDNLSMYCFRLLSQNKLAKKIFLLLPFSLRMRLANFIHKYSTRKIKVENWDISMEKARRWLNKYNSSQIIHGHIHQTKTDSFMLNNQTMRRFSLQDWENTPNALIYYENGSYYNKII